jgi:hypothetical protein
MTASNRRQFLKNSLFTTLAIPFAGFSRPRRGTFPISGLSRETAYYKIALNPKEPAFDLLAVDSLGGGKFPANPLSGSRVSSPNRYAVRTTERGVAYRFAHQPADVPPVWEFTFGENTFTVTSRYAGSGGGGPEPLELLFVQRLNHATLLGRLEAGSQRVPLPCLLHLPGMGSVRLSSHGPAALLYDARRFVKEPYVRVVLPAATAENPEVTYTWEITAIHPPLPPDADGAAYEGYRRNFLNIFQLNPRLGVLANNASSDACAFTLYKYSEVARRTPPLAEGVTALGLIRDTLDQYLDGQKAYGLVGFNGDKDPELAHADIIGDQLAYNHLDSFPSLLIAACNYVRGSKDAAWAGRRYEGLKKWAEAIWRGDATGNGLIKHPESGNSGSWDGSTGRRPANWWDTVGFGHEDAYSNALAYRATVLFAQLAHGLGRKADATHYGRKAKKLKSVYYPTFYNPATGVLAGWRSADGKLHDYYFTFVNGVAIHYGLIDPKPANRIMDALLEKMRRVGYTRFELGLPGNLVCVDKSDYTHHDPRWGYSEDGVKGFQVYENGGATACFAYFTIAALQRLGRTTEADAILRPMLKSFSEGRFEGKAENGMSYDWKDWQGNPNGYEGFLVDSYLTFLAVAAPLNKSYPDEEFPE